MYGVRDDISLQNSAKDEVGIVAGHPKVIQFMANDLSKVAEDSARGGFFLVLGTAIATIIVAVTAILVGRLLGPELYGQYALAISLPELLFLVADLGINQSVIRFTANLNTRGETQRLIRIIRHAFLLKALVGTLLFVLSYSLADFSASSLFQRPELAFYIRIASISILFQVIFAVATSAFVGLDKTEYSALAMNVQAIAKTIISIALVLVGFGVAGAILGYAAGYVIAAFVSVLTLFLVLRKKQGNLGSQTSEDLRTLLHYATPLYISILLTGFIPLFQNVMLANFTTDADIGNFKAAMNFATLITVLSVPITAALLPAFSKVDPRSLKTKTLFKLANKYTALLIIPATVLVIAFSDVVVRIIYGLAYQSASLFLATYCLVYFLVGLGYLTFTSFYNGIGETKITLKISLITFIVLALLSPLLTRTYHALGLVIAFLIANGLGIIYAFYKARKAFGLEFEFRPLSKIYLIAAIASLPSFLMLRFGFLSQVASFVIGTIVYLFIYLTLIPLGKVVTFDELQMVRDVTEKIRSLRLISKPIIGYAQKLARARWRIP